MENTDEFTVIGLDDTISSILLLPTNNPPLVLHDPLHSAFLMSRVCNSIISLFLPLQFCHCGFIGSNQDVPLDFAIPRSVVIPRSVAAESAAAAEAGPV